MTDPAPKRPPVAAAPGGVARLPAFSIAKTPFQKHREEQEERRRKEAEDAAKLYAEFASSFEDDTVAPAAGGGGGKVFVRGEVVKDGRAIASPVSPAPAAKSSTTTAARKPELYKPPMMAAATKTTARPPVESRRLSDDEETATKRATSDNKRKRALDEFLEELKREQEDRELRLAGKLPKIDEPPPILEQTKGSFDTGDPTTTNIYVGNLSPNITEDLLCREFGKYGPVASVKIMWPRSDEERVRNHNSGFVSFMKRPDAERAIRELDGKEIMAYAIRLNWGKAVPLPSVPIYDPAPKSGPPVAEAVQLPFSARPSLRLRAQRLAAPPPGVAAPPIGQTGSDMLEISVDIPEDKTTRRRIHRTIEFVIKFGPRFEIALIEQQRDNPDFKFLVDTFSPEHVYYRWRLFSLMQGDAPESWRTEPFFMFMAGPMWVPPLMPERDHSYVDEYNNGQRDDKLRSAKGGLISRDRDLFEEILGNLTLQRYLIGDAMTFVMEHADAADEIAGIVADSLTVAETPLPLKVARLFLVSDILHNSSLASVSNAWKFRASFESHLAMVFKHLNLIYRAIPARLRADQFKNYIVSVLTAWDRWAVYPPHVLQEWRSLFLAAATAAASALLETIAKHPLNAERVEVVNRRPTEHTAAKPFRPPSPLLAVSHMDHGNNDSVWLPPVATMTNEHEDAVEQEEEEDIDGEPIPEGLLVSLGQHGGYRDDEIEEDIDGEPVA